MILALNQYPELKKIVVAAKPDYRKKNVIIHVVTELELFNQRSIASMNDSSSWSDYTAVNLTTLKAIAAVDMGLNTPNFKLPKDICIVSTGYFCGKKATASIYFHPDNVAKLIPGSKS
jgi:hypothetical protein